MLVIDQTYGQNMTEALKLVEETRAKVGLLEEVHILPDKRCQLTNRFRVKIKYYDINR